MYLGFTFSNFEGDNKQIRQGSLGLLGRILEKRDIEELNWILSHAISTYNIDQIFSLKRIICYICYISSYFIMY